MTDQYDALLQLCKERHSIRQFSTEPVPQAAIEKIRSVAQTSPYASGRKNWQIIAIDEQVVIKEMVAVTRQRIQEISKGLRKDFVDGFEEYARQFVGFENAPLLILPVFRISPLLSYMQTEPDPLLMQWERDNYVKSIACVTMLVLLAATSLGLGACFMTGPLLAEENLNRLAGVGPGKQLGAIVPVGYPASN